MTKLRCLKKKIIVPEKRIAVIENDFYPARNSKLKTDKRKSKETMG